MCLRNTCCFLVYKPRYVCWADPADTWPSAEQVGPVGNKAMVLEAESPPKPKTGDGQGFMATKSTFRAIFHTVYLMSREVFALRRTEVCKEMLRELLGPFQDFL